MYFGSFNIYFVCNIYIVLFRLQKIKCFEDEELFFRHAVITNFAYINYSAMFANEVGTLCETHNNTFRENAYLITLLFI